MTTDAERYVALVKAEIDQLVAKARAEERAACGRSLTAVVADVRRRAATLVVRARNEERKRAAAERERMGRSCDELIENAKAQERERAARLIVSARGQERERAAVLVDALNVLLGLGNAAASSNRCPRLGEQIQRVVRDALRRYEEGDG
jgi:hypothetical protein